VFARYYTVFFDDYRIFFVTAVLYEKNVFRSTNRKTHKKTVGLYAIATQSANYHQIPTGTYYIWSTMEWLASSQDVSFSSNNGMSGTAYAYLYSTLVEAETHS